MSLRIVEVIVPEKDLARVTEILKEQGVIEPWVEGLSSGLGRARVLLPTEKTERTMDALRQRFSGDPSFRVILQRVEAALPEWDDDASGEQVDAGSPEAAAAAERKRVSRDELYQSIDAGARLTTTYLVTVALSTVVAAVGLVRGDVAIIIGAMVIAPLLGPNVALALAMTLGDLRLAARALRALGAGVAVGAALSVTIGLLVSVDPVAPQLSSRTVLSLSDPLVALAAGVTGALAFTTGLPAALIGVMMAVALLPPLVTAGLLLGSSHPVLALRAAALLLTNVACVNLAGVVTFLAQRIRPRTWWEERQAKKATRLAILFWIGVLLVLVALITIVWND